MSPEQAALEAFTKEKGLFSFYEDGHKECCGVRKIAPLKRKLTTLDAWITGQRKDQSPGTRTEIDLVEKDNFQGARDVLYKYNPLANWTSAQVWEYIKIFDVSAIAILPDRDANIDLSAFASIVKLSIRATG